MNLKDGAVLVRLARQSISTFFTGNLIDQPDLKRFKQKRGVFVTLEKYTNLRGCIGYPEPIHELDRAVIDAARSAAFKDPRFPPLTRDELDLITVEVSVLTTPIKIEVEDYVQYLDHIKIGFHGLIARKGDNSGLLLPQVFPEYECTPKAALEMTCEKAGLDKDAWKEPDTEIYSFSAEIFREKEPHGKVIRVKDKKQ